MLNKLSITTFLITLISLTSTKILAQNQEHKFIIVDSATFSDTRKTLNNLSTAASKRGYIKRERLTFLTAFYCQET